MELKCDNCGKSETDQGIVPHGDENWCCDCMRQAGHCVTCDAHIPHLVEDYYNYQEDQCPKCIESENKLVTL